MGREARHRALNTQRTGSQFAASHPLPVPAKRSVDRSKMDNLSSLPQDFNPSAQPSSGANTPNALVPPNFNGPEQIAMVVRGARLGHRNVSSFRSKVFRQHHPMRPAGAHGCGWEWVLRSKRTVALRLASSDYPRCRGNGVRSNAIRRRRRTFKRRMRPS